MNAIPEIDVSWMASFPTPNAHNDVDGVTKNVPENAFPGVAGGTRTASRSVAADVMGAEAIAAVARKSNARAFIGAPPRSSKEFRIIVQARRCERLAQDTLQVSREFAC